MAEDTRLRSPHHERDSIREWPQKPSTKAELEELRAKVNQLEYGGITADKLGGGTISSQSIELAENASLFTGSPTADGFVLDKDGLRFYDSGVNTIDLRADGGTATFSGNITASTITGGTFRTAASGERIEIDAGTYDTIGFYSGDVDETAPGRILVFSDSTNLTLGLESPHGGGDYASIIISGAKTSGDSAVWSASVYSSSSVLKGQILLHSSSGLFVQTTQSLLRIDGNAGFQFARPASTNTSQLRFESIPAGGTTQVALGVDNGVVANELIVHAFNGTTPLGISASGFHVISNSDGKTSIESLTPGALNRVKQLRPVRYVRPGHRLEQTKGRTDPGAAQDRVFVGFLAEEILTQFPEAVVKDKEGKPFAIDVMAVVAVLTQAVQELAARGNSG